MVILRGSPLGDRDRCSFYFFFFFFFFFSAQIQKGSTSATASRKGHLVAYLRVSATDQSLATQLAKVKALGNVDRVFKEKASGLRHDRPMLEECLAYLRDGDTLVVTRADRIARSAAHLLGTVQALGLVRREE